MGVRVLGSVRVHGGLHGFVMGTSSHVHVNLHMYNTLVQCVMCSGKSNAFNVLHTLWLHVHVVYVHVHVHVHVQTIILHVCQLYMSQVTLSNVGVALSTGKSLLNSRVEHFTRLKVISSKQ